MMPVYHTRREFQVAPLARQWHAWGANVAAIKRGTKHPAHAWKPLQDRRQTEADLDALPLEGAAALAIFNGPGGWRVFDLDATKGPDGKPLKPVDERDLIDLLTALGLPQDYEWSYISGSGAGYGVVIRCDELPAIFTDNPKGVYIGDPLPGRSFKQLELRWASGITIIAGEHPLGPGYRFRGGEASPELPPATLSPDDVGAGFAAIAYQGGYTPPTNGIYNGVGIFSAPAQPLPTTGTAYGSAALDSAYRLVSGAQPGERNNILFAQVTALAELANGGEVAPDDVERAMTAAGLAAGLGPDETGATIRSAFQKVGGKARQAPPKGPQNAPRGAKTAPVGPATPKQAPPPAKMPSTAPSADPTAAPLDAQHEYRLNDTGNAERFAARYRDAARYDHSSGKWLIWSTTHWQIDDNGAVQRLAKATVYSLYQEATEAYQGGDDDRASVVGKWARTSSGEARRNAMINLARSEHPLAITYDRLNANSDLLNCRNGTLNLMTGQLHPHDRDDLITYCLPFDYDPQAPAPVWDAFIERITEGDHDLARFLGRAVGYTLGGDANEQCFFFLYGFGANGKSTFIETVMALFGDMATKARAQVLMQDDRDRIPNEIAALAGKRLVVASELADGGRLNEGLVKDLTGGDTMSARFLHKEAFNFRPTFRLWLYGNHKPVITGTDNGIWRRIRLIPFMAQIPESEQDPDLAVKLRGELPGILAWAIRGRQEYQRQGLNPPKKVIQATADYRTDSDVLGLFFSENCVYGPNFTAQAGDLYGAYTVWAEANGLKALSNVRFARALAERGLTKVKDNVGRAQYQGIGLLLP